jgi:hypothetical protein
MIKYCDVPKFSINFFLILILTTIVYSFLKKSNKEMILDSLSKEIIAKIYINKKKNYKIFMTTFGIISFFVLIINPFENCF